MKLARIIPVVVLLAVAIAFGQTKKADRYKPPPLPDPKIKADAPDDIRKELERGKKWTKAAYDARVASVHMTEAEIEKLRRNRNAVQRKLAIAQKESRISELKAEIESLAAGKQIAQFDGAALGKIGVMDGGSRVKTIIDEKTILLDVNIGSQRGDGTELIFLVGMSSKGLVDEQAVRIKSPLRITGTRAYTTVLGANKTVFVAEPFDPSPYYVDEEKDKPDK